MTHNRIRRLFGWKPLRVGVVFCCGLLCFGIVGANSQTRPPLLMLPYEMHEDFQGESLGQWASYPPAQDIGYEPSLSPTADHGAPGGRALMRVVKPNRVGEQRFGFIKKVRMAIAGDSRFRFAYRLNSTTPATIEVGLAGIDGRAYTTKVAAQINQWSIAEFSASQLRAPVGVGIEAVYIVARIPHADPDLNYRFIIDDVRFTAVREARFDVTIPRAETIEPWLSLISANSYRPEDTIGVEARSPLRIAKAECLLETQSGGAIVSENLYDDGSHGDRIAGDGIWTNNKLYHLKSADPAGLWLGRLRGTTTKGQLVETTIRLMVRPEKTSNHPRLFFAATDRERLIARSRDSKLATLWSHLQTSAKTTRASGQVGHGGDVFELLDSEYLLPSLLAYFDVLNRARSRIAYNALDAYITGNVEARDAAKATMVAVARWKHWEPPWFRAHGQHTYYPAGLLAADVALGYDLLYDDLSEPERVLIRRALIEKSIIPTFKEYVADNRLMANTSNWLAHTVGGALIAVASIADDIGETENDGRLEIYIGGLLRKLEDHMEASFLADGSYGEGISYQEFDLETLAPALIALQRTFGVDYWKRTHVLHSLSYALYTLTEPVSASLDMGDTHAPAGHGISALVYQSKDPVVRWYFQKFDRPTISKFIFYDDSIAPQPPSLPSSRIFSQKGNAVFRTGWAGDDIVFLFRAGPNFNHHHADQGSFLLTAFGEPLITEAGWSDYYKDPYYATFFTQAVGHNTILVDGNPESQTIADTPQFKALNSYPRISNSVTSEFYDGLESELSSVYQERLARYGRTIVFVKPHYFVVYDDLKVNGNPAQFDLLLHLPDREKIKLKDLTAIYNGERASLGVRSFLPRHAELKVKNGRIPYHIFSARTPAETPAQPAYLSFKTGQPVDHAQFLTAIVPAKNQNAAQSLISQMSEIAGEKLNGVRVRRGTETDLVMFRSVAEAQMIRQDEWSADAASLVITLRENNLKMFAVQNARLLRRANTVLFSSRSPASVAANFSLKELEVVCNAETATRIDLFVGESPDRVLLDGKAVSATGFRFNSTDGTITLDIPSGQHTLKITFR